MNSAEVNAELDKLIEAWGLTSDTANRIDNAGHVNTNGYVPENAGELAALDAKMARLKRG